MLVLGLASGIQYEIRYILRLLKNFCEGRSKLRLDESLLIDKDERALPMNQAKGEQLECFPQDEEAFTTQVGKMIIIVVLRCRNMSLDIFKLANPKIDLVCDNVRLNASLTQYR